MTKKDASPPTWLERARCAKLAKLASDVDSLVTDKAASAKKEREELEARTDMSEFAKELEMDVRLEASRAELDHAIQARVSASRSELGGEIDDGGASKPHRAQSLSAFDRDAKKIGSAAAVDFKTKVSGNSDAGGAVLSFAERMRAAKAAAEAAIAVESKPQAPPATPEPTIRCRETEPPPPRKKALFVTAGCLAVAAVASAGFMFSRSGGDDKPAEGASRTETKLDDAPLGAGSPNRLRKYQEHRREVAKRDRLGLDDTKRIGPKRVFTEDKSRPKRRANSAPAGPTERAVDDEEPASDESAKRHE